MTTYTLNGFTVRSDETGTIVQEAFTTVTDIVVQDGSSTYSFDFLPSEFPQFQDVNFNIPGLVDFRINGTSRIDLLQSAEWTLASFQNNFGQTYIFLGAYDFASFPNDFEFYFSYGGTPLPIINNVASANAFYQSLNLFSFSGTIPGVNGNVPYALSALPGVTVSENDLIVGTAGADNLTAGLGSDTIQAGMGADEITLIASDGADSIDGGAGTDFVIYDTGGLPGSVVVEADLDAGFVGVLGNPVSRSNLSSVEIFAVSGVGSLSFLGADADEYVQGTPDDDTLDGGMGNDTLEGRDGANALFGGLGEDTLRGGTGDDTLNGGSGADSMNGGDGVDLVSFSGATDRVLVDLLVDGGLAPYAVFYSRGAAEGDVFVNIEDAQGGGFSDQLRGDNGANVLDGDNGWDRLYGRQGDDTLIGGLGGDMLYGNAGADTMTGGTTGQRDRFIYFRDTDSGVGAGNRDVITDFQSGVDRIEISRIEADITQNLKQPFDFIGATAFSNTAGELRYEQSAGATIVQADFDGDGASDFEIELTGVINLQVYDFQI